MTGKVSLHAAKVFTCRRSTGGPSTPPPISSAYLACEHLTELERAALAGLVERPMRDDPELDIIRKRGFEHEARYLADLEADGRHADEDRARRLDRGRRRPAARRGDRDDRRDGRRRRRDLPGDLLRRHMARPRRLPAPCRQPRAPVVWGPYHYEVADTKLARHVKASAVLQICSYVDQLERIQGVRPEWLHVALGGQRPRPSNGCASTTTWPTTGRQGPLPCKRSRTAAPITFPPTGTYPEPVDHCDVCRWAAECVPGAGPTTT